jgi:tRNA pseudouridine38-40 synthase
MRTLKLTVAYDGTNYVGWQRQENGLAIQQVLEQALLPLCRNRERAPGVVGASRTDAGVHAKGQVASVRVDFDIPVDAVLRAINIRLPADIRVLAVAEAGPAFHAQFDARSKRYRYRIVSDAILSPFDRWFAWHVPQRCDVEAMRRAASALHGTHDFSAFQASGSSITDAVRTIARVEVIAQPGGILVEVAGDGFLRHMVRIIVGSLVDVGVGTRTVGWMSEVLAARDRRMAGRTAPAAGLCLEEVVY